MIKRLIYRTNIKPNWPSIAVLSIQFTVLKKHDQVSSTIQYAWTNCFVIH